MHAALITGKQSVELVEFPDPTPPPRGVVVDIALCGICGTDVHAFQSGQPYHPAICGHEWCGTVSAVGAEVKHLREGDRVVVAVLPSCGKCAPCRAGHADKCMSTFLSAIGRDPLAPPHGGFAPRISVDAHRVVKTHSGLTDAQAAQVEPSTVALHAVRASGIKLGDIAVVQGAGPIGLGTLQWVRAAGAGVVVAIEPHEGRRRLASKLGAHYAVTPGAEADELLKSITNGLGADIVYECVGRPAAVQGAVDLARRGGSMCLIGLSETEASITPAAWLIKEISVTAALAYTHEEFDMVMGMIGDGRFVCEPMHTSTVGLTGLKDAFDDLAGGHTEQVKVLVDPRL